ncbi:hypothetical protein CHUAL_013659 [Chamberlinius hualienensis]
MAGLISLLVLATCICSMTLADPHVFVCYYGTWATYRPGNGQFNVEHIDPNLCTHFVYAFAKLDEGTNTIQAFDPWLDLPEGRDNYRKFVKRCHENPSAKALLAIGGWNEGSTKYSNMVKTPQTRNTFVKSASAFVKQFGFDGLDFDWEYPAFRGGVPEDKQNFVSLLQELRTEFNQYGLLLTLAIGAGKEKLDESYDIPAISKSVDLINVMTYDYHGSWETFTGIVAPLYPRSGDTLENQQLTVNFSINYLLGLDAPKDKIVMGMPVYGNTFTLANPNNNSLYAPASSPGQAGPYTGQPGFLGYNEICEKFKNEPWTKEREEEQRVPYAFMGSQWVGYDNPQSIAEKVQYLLDNGLHGAMVWSIETDDFRSLCGPKNIIQTTIRNGLDGGSTTESTDTTSSFETTTSDFTTESPETSTSVEDYIRSRCPEHILIQDPTNCSIYWQCVDNGSGDYVLYDFSCSTPNLLGFNEATQQCDYREQVLGCKPITKKYKKFVKTDDWTKSSDWTVPSTEDTSTVDYT